MMEIYRADTQTLPEQQFRQVCSARGADILFLQCG